MSHYHHWSKQRKPELMPFIRRGGQPAHCGCEVCENLYAECRQEAEKILAEYDFKNFNEAERLQQFLREPVEYVYLRSGASQRDETIKWLMTHTVCLDGLTLLMVDEEDSGVKHGPCFEEQRKEAHAFLQSVGAVRGDKPPTGRLTEKEVALLFGRWRPWAEPGSWPPRGRGQSKI